MKCYFLGNNKSMICRCYIKRKNWSLLTRAQVEIAWLASVHRRESRLVAVVAWMRGESALALLLRMVSKCGIREWWISMLYYFLDKGKKREKIHEKLSMMFSKIILNNQLYTLSSRTCSCRWCLPPVWVFSSLRVDISFPCDVARTSMSCKSKSSSSSSPI